MKESIKAVAANSHALVAEVTKKNPHNPAAAKARPMAMRETETDVGTMTLTDEGCCLRIPSWYCRAEAVNAPFTVQD